MKKWNIIHTAFSIVFLAVWTYFAFFKKWHSLNWLIFTLVGFVLILAGSIIIAVLKNKESKGEIIGRICTALFFLSFGGYHEIGRYKDHVCDVRFGREFNERRLKLGVPAIPADWQADEEWHRSATWKAKDTIGHISKYIGIDSSCVARYEDDDYKFKPINGKARSMSIHTRYATKQHGFDMSYYYDPGIDTGRYLTRQQSDSVFAAEKIKKDY